MCVQRFQYLQMQGHDVAMPHSILTSSESADIKLIDWPEFAAKWSTMIDMFYVCAARRSQNQPRLPVKATQRQLLVDFWFQLCPICLNLWQKCKLQKTEVLLFEENEGSQCADLFCLFFPLLFYFVPSTTCVCRKLAAGKQTPEGERTWPLSQLKLPFWQVHRRQAGGQSKQS